MMWLEHPRLAARRERGGSRRHRHAGQHKDDNYQAVHASVFQGTGLRRTCLMTTNPVERATTDVLLGFGQRDVAAGVALAGYERGVAVSSDGEAGILRRRLL